MEKRQTQSKELIPVICDFLLMTIGAKIHKKLGTDWNGIRREMLEKILTGTPDVSQLKKIGKMMSLRTQNEFDKIMSALKNVKTSLAIRKQSTECEELFNSAISYDETRKLLEYCMFNHCIFDRNFIINIRNHEENLNRFLQQMEMTYENMNTKCEVLSFDDDGSYPDPAEVSSSDETEDEKN